MSKRITYSKMYCIGTVEPIGRAKPTVAFLASGVVDTEAAVKAYEDEPEVQADTKAPVKTDSLQSLLVEPESSFCLVFI